MNITGETFFPRFHGLLEPFKTLESRVLMSIAFLPPVGHSGILQLLMLCSISPEQCLTLPSPASILRLRVLALLLPQVAEQADQEPHWPHWHRSGLNGLQ